MQQTINIQELENALNKYGDIVLTKNSKNDVIIMSISEYKRKLKDNELSKKLEKAEQQIKDGKTVKATTVFRELEEKYGKTLTAEDYFVPDYKRKSPLIKCFEEYMNKVLSEWKFSLEDIEEKHFVDKNIVEQSKAFEHLDNLNLNKNNAFLLSKRNHH